ncbi:Uncharacterised protein [Vibrio cholerae]|nr:Uncharacterised protein [Vibrio cholerae]
MPGVVSSKRTPRLRAFSRFVALMPAPSSSTQICTQSSLSIWLCTRIKLLAHL